MHGPSVLGATGDQPDDQPGDQPEDHPDDHPEDRPAGGALIHLSAAGTSLLLDCRGPRLPRVLYWGAALGRLDEDELADIARCAIPAVVPNGLDEPVPVGVLPEHATGWLGLPGLRGHRDGRDWSALFEVESVSGKRDRHGGGAVEVVASDRQAALALTLSVRMTPQGLVRLRASVTNQGPTPYTVDGLVLALPLPDRATELLELTGRWGRERSPQRRSFEVSTHVRDSRRGRTGSDSTLVVAVGEPGFGFRTGGVWGLHVGWSGTHRTFAERLPSGEAVIGGGEWLRSGEVRLEPGDSYRTPDLFASYGDGLDELSERFHGFLRTPPAHPALPRPVVVNTWEAVYFDQDLDRLRALADRAAQVGGELFVLDDGWFRGRRDDTRGLGDWYVDPDLWPDGLHPLVDHVRGLGLRFGLWVEPEMVNPDSELARRHPDWVAPVGRRTPPLIRHQQVLDLSRPEAWAYLLERLDALVTEYRLDYFKWDHNRDLVDFTSADGTPGVHRQTEAVYALIDELRRRHPGLEIESCSSGGARVDLGILARTSRVWASDCIDPLERQSIQRWTGLLLPPELIGSHIGSPRSHTTGRRHDLSFRAGTALFGALGIEWDLTAATEAETADLARWIALYKQHRDWLHRGRVVRSDATGPDTLVHGIVAADASQALYAVVQVATAVTTSPRRILLPGLPDGTRFAVRPVNPDGVPGGIAITPAPWLDGGVTLSGRTLAEVGLAAPPLHPEQLLVLHARAAAGGDPAPAAA